MLGPAKVLWLTAGMAEPARSVPDPRPRGVVHPISRAATRRCSRPGCPAPATATLTFDYGQQHAALVALVPDGGPETYDLCGDHADRTRPPYGWSLHDDRPEDLPVDTPDSVELGSPQTVAVLAAALRGEPQSVPDLVDDADPVDPVGAADPEGVDVATLDAIADQPFEDLPVDLYGAEDEADPAADDAATAPSDALTELSALSGRRDADATSDDDETGIVEQVPARTVPGAHRPA